MFDSIVSKKLSKINDIYCEINKWLMTESSNYRDLINVELKNNAITSQYLDERYNITYT